MLRTRVTDCQMDKAVTICSPFGEHKNGQNKNQKPHAHLQNIIKQSTKFQINPTKEVGGVVKTSFQKDRRKDRGTHGRTRVISLAPLRLRRVTTSQRNVVRHLWIYNSDKQKYMLNTLPIWQGLLPAGCQETKKWISINVSLCVCQQRILLKSSFFSF